MGNKGKEIRWLGRSWYVPKEYDKNSELSL